MSKIRKYKDTEKRELLESRSYEKMTDDKKDTDKMLQKHKLGRWNKGLQTGVYKYDTKTYNEERSKGNPLFPDNDEDITSEENAGLDVGEGIGLDVGEGIGEAEEMAGEDDHQEMRNEDYREQGDEDDNEYDNEEGYNDSRPYDD